MAKIKSGKGVAVVLVVALLSLIPLACAENQSFQYDANGNLIQDNGYYYEYNDANQLAKVRQSNSTGPVLAEYKYDADGKRIAKIIGNVTTLYIDDYFEVQVNGTEVRNTSYYFANGERVARKEPDGSFKYYHGDHLGSTSVLTNSSGGQVERTQYEPYGAVLSGGEESKYLYTGQENDPETGLYYYGARYYNPGIGRWAEADTIIQDPYDPQTLNRYSYVRNNPMKYIDPTGHFVFFGTWDFICEQTPPITPTTVLETDQPITPSTLLEQQKPVLPRYPLLEETEPITPAIPDQLKKLGYVEFYKKAGGVYYKLKGTLGDVPGEVLRYIRNDVEKGHMHAIERDALGKENYYDPLDNVVRKGSNAAKIKDVSQLPLRFRGPLSISHTTITNDNHKNINDGVESRMSQSDDGWWGGIVGFFARFISGSSVDNPRGTAKV